MNKRMITVLVAQVVTALLIGLNNKLDLGLDSATVTALAASMGATLVTYLWSQAKTDVAETKESDNA